MRHAYPVSEERPDAQPPGTIKRNAAELIITLITTFGSVALVLLLVACAISAFPTELLLPLPLRLAAEAACAAYLTDVLSGTVHFTLDHADSGDALRGEMPTDLGSARAVRDGERARGCNIWQRFVWKFQVHHSLVWPRSLTAKSQSQSQIDALSVVFCAMMAALWRRGALEQAWLLRILVATAVLSLNIQRAHFWCHERTHSPQTLPAAVRWLQDAGLLLHPEWHRVHHEHYDRHFPIFNGWSNTYCQALFRTCVACGLVDPAAGQKPVKRGPPPPLALAATRAAPAGARG